LLPYVRAHTFVSFVIAHARTHAHARACISQNKPHESAHIAVREAYAHEALTDRVTGLQVPIVTQCACSHHTRAQRALTIYRDSKDSFHATQTEDQIRLLLLQREIALESGIECAGLSLGDTIYKVRVWRVSVCLPV
jgi:hypothetical protein